MCQPPHEPGWITPVSLFAAISETSARSLSRAGALNPLQPNQIDDAIARDADALDTFGRKSAACEARKGARSPNEQPAERRLSRDLNQWRERERVARCARGEDQVARIGFDQRRDGIARLLDPRGAPRVPRGAPMMDFQSDRARRRRSRAPRYAPARFHSSRDRRDPLILYPPRFLIQEVHIPHTSSKDLHLAFEFVQTGLALPAPLSALPRVLMARLSQNLE